MRSVAVWRKKNKCKAESPISHNPPNKGENQQILGNRLVFICCFLLDHYSLFSLSVAKQALSFHDFTANN